MMENSDHHLINLKIEIIILIELVICINRLQVKIIFDEIERDIYI
jgi:hypothetical protein